MIRRFFLPLLVGLLAFLPAACDDSKSWKVAEGQPAPDFTLPDLDGRDVRLSSLKGHPVVIRFWSDWSPACEEEMMAIEPIYSELKGQGLEVLSVNVGQHEQTARDFVAKLGVSYPTLHDRHSEVAGVYGVVDLPSTFFLNSTGKVVGKIVGEAKDGEFVALVKKAIS